MAWWVLGLWVAGSLLAVLLFALGAILGRRGAFEQGYEQGYEAGLRAAGESGTHPQEALAGPGKSGSPGEPTTGARQGAGPGSLPSRRGSACV